MINFSDIMETVEMIDREHLDVRTVTMGISLLDCASDSPETLYRKVYDKITTRAKDLVSTAESIEKEYGIPIIHKRVSVTPASLIGGCLDRDGYVRLAQTLDRAARDVGINFIGGFSALVQKGMTATEKVMLDSIPEALASTEVVCSSVNVGSTKSGINMDAVLIMGKKIKETA